MTELVLQDSGLVTAAETLRVRWMPGSQIGLFAADIYPDQWTSLASLRPCSWSGYPGLLVLGTWAPAVMEGSRAILAGPPVLYVHSGGPVGQMVVGYYVCDSAGILRWAQRLPDGPVLMALAGQALTVAPQFALRSSSAGRTGMSTLYGTQDLDVDVATGAQATIAAVGSLHGAVLDLVQVNGPWGRTANYAALLAGVATFSGYAQGTITWDAASLDETGQVELVGTSPAFRQNGGGTANQIYGVIVQNAGATKLYFNGPVDGGPIDMSVALDQLIVTIRWKPATNAVTVSIG